MKTRARIGVQVLVVLGMMSAGFLMGWISGPYILPDIDLFDGETTAATRVNAWGVLCAIGIGVITIAVLTIRADRRRVVLGGIDGKRALFGFWVVLGLSAVAFLPALVCLTMAFGFRPAMARVMCTHHLKQIALAMSSYHDEYGCLPPAYVADEHGKPMHSWRVLLLPYLESKPLYDSYRFSEPWDGPNNRKIGGQMPDVYGCGADHGRGKSMTSYLAITGEHSAFPGSGSIKIGDIRDGTSQTLSVVECGNSGILWTEPQDCPIKELRLGPARMGALRIGGNHPGGGNAAFADGSVHFLHEGQIKPATLEALGTIDGGEAIGPEG